MNSSVPEENDMNKTNHLCEVTFRTFSVFFYEEIMLYSSFKLKERARKKKFIFCYTLYTIKSIESNNIRIVFFLE